MTILEPHRQHDHRVRFEWGPTGAQALAPVDFAVVVDVLSFTTTVTVAAERGIAVFPFPWRDDRAAAYAEQVDAVLAVGRLEAAREDAPGVSLSPAAMSHANGFERIVLPSPNGSSICSLLDGQGAVVLAASLRNASAVADWLAPRLYDRHSVALVASGEKWPDDSLRPAVEDLWGAGAVIDKLVAAGMTGLSAEARAAGAAFASVRDRLQHGLRECASGRELIATGFAADVDMAAESDVSSVVPILRSSAFKSGSE